ncbi:Hypothetical predicted protein [Mytilus galloprovincialis]|uniref:Uncharacterized protein n=1 Tax=Mytilus galloprovincialis TaxID=29158 RepID=A0A8B6GY53_MYTGA|nr:Hypothetical predicted protein [Mytilus galloprovincialis]
MIRCELCATVTEVQTGKRGPTGSYDINTKAAIDLSIEKQRELEPDISTSESAVFGWKCHIVTLVAQDSCRKEKLLNLKNGEVMVVRDWVMKFLPLLFREK